MQKTFKLFITLLLLVSTLLMTVLPSFSLSPSVSVSSLYSAGPYYTKLLSVELTGDMRKDIVAVAKSQVGYTEGNSSSQVAGTSYGSGNYTEYNNYMFSGNAGGWCGMFVSWCAAMARIPSTIIKPATSAKPQYYSGYGFNFVGENALEGSSFKGFYDLPVKGGSYIPAPGDIIFFGYSNAKNVFSLGTSTYKHVGIVDYSELVYGNDGSISKIIIHTLEGNVSNMVKEKSYTMTASSSGYIYTDTYITGFAIPAYQTSDAISGSCYDIGAYGGSLLKVNQSSGDAVIKMQLALKVLAMTNSSITAPSVNGTFDTATYNALKQYQTLKGLEVDGCCGPASWASLRSAMVAATAADTDPFIMNGSTLVLYKGKSANVTLPANCKSIAPYAFYGAASLQNLTVERTLTAISSNVFSSCTSLSTVTYLGTAQVFSSLSVSSTGNAPFINAKKVYKPTVYNITFDVKGTKTTVSCVEGTLPVFTGSTNVAADELMYFFVGWDKPLAAATKDTTYVAQFYTLPNATVVLTGGAQKTFSGSTLTFDLYLKNTPGVSSFCFNLDYSLCLTELYYKTFKPAIAGVSCDSSLEGMLKFSYDGSTLPEGDLRIGSVSFKVGKDLAFNDQQICELMMVFMATDGYMRHKAESGAVYDLPLSCDLVSLPIYDRLVNDFTSDGQLSISDVSELLNILSGSSESGYSADSYSISDVSTLLNLLADA